MKTKIFIWCILLFSLYGCLQQQGISKAIVGRVIDGDTIVLGTEEKVRLIGIDTPERGEECFEEGKIRMQQLTEGKEISMIKDISETDKYGRLLRYIYVGNDFINLIMIQEGYAHAYKYEPDVKYANIFKIAELSADKNGCLWRN
jgi:micrococcal nuclease